MQNRPFRSQALMACGALTALLSVSLAPGAQAAGGGGGGGNPTSTYNNAGATDPDRAPPVQNNVKDASDPTQAPPKEGSARQAIADIFNAAKALEVQKQFAAALDKLAEADNISNLTRYEQGLIETLRIVAALQTDNNPVAIKALQGLPDTATAEQRALYTMAITATYFNAKDYPNTVEWAKRYLSEGGPDREKAESLLTRAYYLSNDYVNVTKAILEALAREEQAGTVPPESQLQILQNVSLKQKDTANYDLALSKLVTHYPDADRWDDLIHQRIIRPGYPWEKRALDVFRLEMAVGTLTLPIQVNGYANAAMQAGFPAEAASALDHGPDAGKNTPLRASVRKSYDADQKSLPKAETDAQKSASGETLVRLGMDFYGYGQFDKAIALIQAGIAKGGLKSADDTNLNLGIVYLAAGQKDKALELFKSVTQAGGPAELAQLWSIKAGSVH